MYRIAIVEDDQTISEHIETMLRGWDYEVLRIQSFETVYDDILVFDPHLILMDIILPKYDGFYWCQKIRQTSQTPILFLSSKDTDMDIKMAISIGGDDYVTKPFSFIVLESKIQALLRRSYEYKEVNLPYHLLSLDELGFLCFKDNRIELTKNEARIMTLLLKSPERVIARDLIMQLLWESEAFVDDNTLTVNVNRLRKKMTQIGCNDWIKTKKGEGYYLENTIY